MGLTDAERRSYDELGFLVREQAFTPAEVETMRRATEELCADLVREAHNTKVKVSAHYVFELDAADDVVIKWEPGDDEVLQGVEPFAHLHPVFTDYASHPSFVEPSRAILEVDEVALFTEKLNVKRAHFGGSYALHRDHPYWQRPAEEPDRLVTAWVALDDATAQNGALEVLPGSHRIVDVPYKESELDFERNEIDETRLDTSTMITVEVPAGAAIFFGPFLVHRSQPNNSTSDRRAVLYTYQRAGLRTQRDNVRLWAAAEAGEQ